jgi:MoxR-like ATPase
VSSLIRNQGQIAVVDAVIATLNDEAAMVDQFDAETDAAKAAKAATFNAEEDARIEALMAAERAKPTKVLDAVDVMHGMFDAAGEAETLANSVLDPLRPFLSPVILGQVSTALTPIVARAVKPVEIERVVTVTLDEHGNPVAPVEPAYVVAKVTGKTTLGAIFGVPARNRYAKIAVKLWDAADALLKDPFYVVNPSTMASFITMAERSRAVWLAGPAGTGKSAMPQEYAARTRRPFVAIAFQRAVEPVDLIGSYVLDGKGGMVWRDGVLTRAIRRPGTVILLDEITMAPAGLLAIIQTLLSSRVLTIHATGERVEVAEGVVFAVADNTSGFGDETGIYAGTMQANGALVDRMSYLIPVDYLPADLEAQALCNHTGAPKPACERVVAFVHSARKLSGFETFPLSLRRMIAFVEGALDGLPVEDVFNLVCLTRLPNAEREALRQHFSATFVIPAFEAEMAGNPLPAAPSSEPAQAAAREAFTTVD